MEKMNTSNVSTPFTPVSHSATWEDLGPTGIILDMDESRYHAQRGVCSSSQLKVLDRGTARHLKHQLDFKKDTTAFRVGRALHCGVLEPGLYGDLYATAPQVDKRTKAGKEEYAAFETSVGERTILKKEEGEQVADMIAAIQAHPAASELLEFCPIREATLLATLHGVPCKSRIDAMSSHYGSPARSDAVFCDLKSTKNHASRREVEQDVWRYGYGLQMCMYREMMRENGVDVARVSFIVVEKSPPHGVCVFDVDEDVLDAHRPLLERLLDEWKMTIGRGKFPCWSEKPVPIGVPEWARRELETEGNQRLVRDILGGSTIADALNKHVDDTYTTVQSDCLRQSNQTIFRKD